MPDPSKHELKTLYEEGLTIFRTNNLFGIVDHIPKSDEPEFNQDFSFSQFLKQVVNFPNYQPWFQKLIKYFDKHNLNFAKFEMKIYDVDPREGSSYPGAIFKRTLKEMEEMILRPDYYNSYEVATRKPLVYDEVKFHEGQVSQGFSSHQYRDTRAIELLAFLWNKREFRRPDTSVLTDGELVSYAQVMEALGIKSEDGIKATGEAINKSARQQKIGLRVVYPRNQKGIKLTVTQDTSIEPETV